MSRIQDRKKTEKALLLHSVEELYTPIVHKKGRTDENADGRQTDSEALEAIIAYFGLPAVEVPAKIKAEEAFTYRLRRSGLLMRRIMLEGKWWKQAALPVLAADKEGESVVLLPGRNGEYMEDTFEGPIPLSPKRREQIGSVGYCFYKPLPADETGMKVFWKFLLSSLGVSDVVMIVVISILLELCGLIMPYINQIVYNNVIPSGTVRELPGIVVLVVSSVIFAALIRLARNISVSQIGFKMRLAGQSAIWNRLFTLPAPFFKQYDAGELYNRANAVNTICDILGGGLIPTALTALLSVIYVVQISWFAPALVLPSIVIILVMLVNIAVTGYLQISRSKKMNEKNNKVTGFLYQMIGGITKIRTAGAEVRAYAKWAQFWKEVPLLPAFFLQISDVFGYAISLGGSICLYYLAWKNGLSASSYIAFQTAFASFSMSVLALANFGFQFGALKPSVDMVRPIMEEMPERYGDGEYVEKMQGEIELNSVMFRYTTKMPYVLNGLSLHIKEGEYLGIVGSSGCGKSTLMRLLLGFEKPESGTVYYDGKDIQGLDLPSLRKRIGVVLQNGSLFSGDIYSNIAICAPNLTMDQAWNAAERAGVAEDIEKMPMGMYTMLSEDGGGVSGGQKQRILIARAIASNPDVLLFDEATSALDNRTQETVVKTLKELKCTRLVIAHRLSTIKDCDRIIYLDKGRIVEEGNYEQLMAKNGMFASMAQRQLT
ncbi:MAG: ATP-binding cassette domain-containing protein [Lachnospiraceae bacterium]|nr:ATP-binding cassette domain-containing protein [Lachnospiraceae bacterium]